MNYGVAGYVAEAVLCGEMLKRVIFLSDPGKPGVRSLGPDVCLSVRHKQTTRRL